MIRIGAPPKLSLLGIAGQAISYVLAVALARRLGVAGFEAYALASAAFTLMVMTAPRGVEKYALRLLPALFERRDWERSHGFLRFGLRCTLLGAFVIGAAVWAWAWWVRDFSEGTRRAIVVSCLSLPAGATVHYAVEVVTAAGADVRATAVFRVLVPALTLALAGILFALPLEISGAMAVGCWGVAWIIALVMLAIEFRRAAPPSVWRAQPIQEAAIWRTEARPFWLYRLSLALMSQSSVIALDWLLPSAAAVGAYAAAMGTASMALVLVTATNRAYARQMSVLLERRDFATLLDLRRERLEWLLPATAAFLLVVFAFTRELLAFFRPEFVDEGSVPLRLLAVATAFTMLFALSPTYLKIRRHNRATFTTVACAAAAQLVMLWLLVPAFGATGAAIAHAASMVGAYGAFALIAHHDLTRYRAASAGS